MCPTRVRPEQAANIVLSALVDVAGAPNRVTRTCVGVHSLSRVSNSPRSVLSTRTCCPSTAATLLLELTLVVALPEIRRRPALVIPEADGFEALHGAENIQAAGDVLRGQADIVQRHAL
jgi:hypothetical protein